MSLFATYKQELRAMYPNNLDRDEHRGINLGLLKAVQDSTNHPESILSPDVKQKALESEGRVMKIPVMDDAGDVTISNARSCTIGSLDSDTALVDVTFLTVSADLHMVKEQYRKNEINYLADFGKKLSRIERSFGRVIENSIYAKLDADKSTVFGSTLTPAKYANVGDALQITAAQQEYFFNDLDAIQMADDFDVAGHQIIGSTNLMPSVRHYINQGKSNDETLDYQFGNKAFTFSNRVIDGAGRLATAFAMPFGSIGFLTRINADAESGNKTTTGVEWSNTVLDSLGIRAGVQYMSECADLSAVTGLSHLQSTMVERWQISFDYALITPYNSDPATKAAGTKKFEFLT